MEIVKGYYVIQPTVQCLTQHSVNVKCCDDDDADK